MKTKLFLSLIVFLLFTGLCSIFSEINLQPVLANTDLKAKFFYQHDGERQDYFRDRTDHVEQITSGTSHSWGFYQNKGMIPEKLSIAGRLSGNVIRSINPTLNKLYLPLLGRYIYSCSDKPILLYPAEQYTIDTLIPVYRWDTCDLPGAIQVSLQVSPYPDMSKWVLWLSSSPTGFDSYQDIENLATATTYYWQLQARYSNSEYGPASSGSFRTPSTGQMLAPSTLVSPADNATLAGTSVTFQWQTVSNVDYYQLVLGWSEDGGSTGYYIRVYDTTYTFTYLPVNKTCYWYVSSVNHYAIGPASPTRHFTSGAGSNMSPNPPEANPDWIVRVDP